MQPFLTACLWLGVLISAWLHFDIGLNNDTALLFYHTKRWLEGATLYLDYVNVNPPLINVLYTLPLFASQASGMELYHALHLFAFAVTGASLVIITRILRSFPLSAQTRHLLVAAIGFCLLGASFLHQLFADREYLAVTFILPLLVLNAPFRRMPVSRALHIAVCVFAAIGFSIRPYLLLFYAAALLFRLANGEKLSQLIRQKEPWLIVLLGIIYLICVVIFFPYYFGNAVPLIASTYGSTTWAMHYKLDVVQNTFFPYASAGLALLVALFLSGARRWKILLYVLLLTAVSVLCYLASPGWYYTHFSVMIATLLLSCVAGFECVRCARGIAQPVRRYGVMLVAIALPLGMVGYSYGPGIKSIIEWDHRLMKERGHPVNFSALPDESYQKLKPYLDQHPRFLWLSMERWVIAVLARSERYESAGRFDYVWPLPGILQEKERDQERYRALMENFSGQLADDITRRKPELIINDLSPHQYRMPGGYNLMYDARMFDAFEAAMRDYERVEVVSSCHSKMLSNCLYEIYRRTDMPAN